MYDGPDDLAQQIAAQLFAVAYKLGSDAASEFATGTDKLPRDLELNLILEPMLWANTVAGAAVRKSKIFSSAEVGTFISALDRLFPLFLASVASAKPNQTESEKELRMREIWSRFANIRREQYRQLTSTFRLRVSAAINGAKHIDRLFVAQLLTNHFEEAGVSISAEPVRGFVTRVVDDVHSAIRGALSK
jgi:hypothetical protein